MKTKTFFTTALIILINLFVKADDNNELKKQISKSLSFPKGYNMQKSECIVYVSFLVNESGQIEIITTTTDDEVINTYTKEKLSKLKVKNHVANQVYNYKFVYKKENI